MVNFIYSQLVYVGAHLGASIKNFWFLASWMVWGFTGDICILNLKYSLIFFKLSSLILRATLLFKQPIWFVNLDTTKEVYLRSAALISGEFWLSGIWINGLLSNYYYVFIMLRTFVNTPFYMRSKKLKGQLTTIAQNWFLTRFTWPRLLFISSSSSNMKVIREAVNFGVPCIVISDIVYTTDQILFPIPGNDQSSIAVNFYNQFIANIILRFKFLNVIYWFNNVRRGRTLPSFSKWVQLKINNNKFFKFKHKHFFFKLPLSSIISVSLGLGMVRSGELKKKKLFFFDSFSFSKFDKDSSFFFFVQNTFLFQTLYLTWIGNFWLRSSLFGLKKHKRFNWKRFVCNSSKRFCLASFFCSKIGVLNVLESGCIVYLAQSVLLKIFFNYVDVKFFKRFKRYPCFKKLIPSMYFMVRTQFISKINRIRIISNIGLTNLTLSRVRLNLVHEHKKKYKTFREVRNLWFWNRGSIVDMNFMVPNGLIWFFAVYWVNLYGFRLFTNLKLFFCSEFDFYFTWKYFYNNIWWRKSVGKLKWKRNRFAKKFVK